MQKKKSKLIRMSDIETEQVRWLWYPFIPYGKVTIIQGDPGEGKTSFVLAMIALLTTGKPLPEETVVAEPISVIYQSAEDGLADTIKPRLEASGADCSHVMVIDESDKELTLCDERLEQAVQETGANHDVYSKIQHSEIRNLEEHLAKLSYKIAVEMAQMNLFLASIMEVPYLDTQKLRGKAVSMVNNSRGYVPLSVAVKHRTEIHYMEDKDDEDY